ncbi:carbohydrate ABC transporter permease [Cohnella terricola]|uniref:Carbohydrate ABC transporter permease n=1 Tax=Cohnella terricola TaxID=1289167 RepID=A0A559JT29_9BACL|nr:carbohydrate ABC transporter permease [Cohnella terricola]TVY03025.1 carbohydrate ABC transporter permease [Cohnella terricola]
MQMEKKAPLFIELILIAVSLIFLFPVFFLVEMSFKEPGIFFDPFRLPNSLYLDYYRAAFTKMDFFTGLGNSLIITICGLGLTVIVGSMAGYVLTRRNERLFRFILLFFLTGMVIPAVGSIIPLFKMAIQLKLVNTRTLLVLLYTAQFVPFASFLYSAFTKSIPKDLEESAQIDGCGMFKMYWTIIFPLLMPATGTFIITHVYSIWNDFLTPLIFINQAEKMTLMPQIVQFMFNQQSINYGPVFAVSVLAVLPLVILFVFTQKYMIKGLVLGSVKG